MSEIISEHTDLSEGDQHWLKLLVSEWQLLADLSFSDLVLWVRDHDPNVYWAAAQIRPFTGATSLSGARSCEPANASYKLDSRSIPMPSRSRSAIE